MYLGDVGCRDCHSIVTYKTIQSFTFFQDLIDDKNDNWDSEHTPKFLENFSMNDVKTGVTLLNKVGWILDSSIFENRGSLGHDRLAPELIDTGSEFTSIQNGNLSVSYMNLLFIFLCTDSDKS